MRAVRGFIPVLLVALASACQSAEVVGNAQTSIAEIAAERDSEAGAGRTVHVVSNGWHTGIVLARSDLSPGAIPEIRDFPEAEYFEFSWGDARYFPAFEKRLSVIMNALFTPTPAVLHLAGLPADPREVFKSAETVTLRVTSEGFEKLVTYLDQSFDRHSEAPSIPGLYRFSRFYPATGRFHMFNTCNTWTARGLAAADIPLTVAGTLQAEELMAQLR